MNLKIECIFTGYIREAKMKAASILCRTDFNKRSVCRDINRINKICTSVIMYLIIKYNYQTIYNCQIFKNKFPNTYKKIPKFFRFL